MNRVGPAARHTVALIRSGLWTIACQPERTLMLGAVLLGSVLSQAVGFVLAQYYSVDVLSSLTFAPQDCFVNWGVQVGRHCFSDYPIVGSLTTRPNPWEPLWLPQAGPAYRPLRLEYPAAGMIPQLAFWKLGSWFGSANLGLLIVLLVLTIAVLAPALWAARAARGLERVVVFIACGAAAVPAWVVIDRGNTVGLLAPIGLVFLVALCRRRWGLVAVAVVLAAMVKPQFVVLAVVMFAARQWRPGVAALGGVVATNVAAYLLWPRDFPATIGQSIHNALTSAEPITQWTNVSFAGGLDFALRYSVAVLTGRGVPPLGHGEAVIGYLILLAVVISVLALGRRIDPVMAGIALLAVASLGTPVSYTYYLVFALPVAALVARDPGGAAEAGIFDRLAAYGDRRRSVGVCVSLSTALTIAAIPLGWPQVRLPIPTQFDAPDVGATMTLVPTTVLVAPLAWLLTCAVIVVSYIRTPFHDVSVGNADATLACSEPR